MWILGVLRVVVVVEGLADVEKGVGEVLGESLLFLVSVVEFEGEFSWEDVSFLELTLGRSNGALTAKERFLRFW